MPDATPWPLIRWTQRSAPYWWMAVRRSGSSVVQVSSGAGGVPTASLTPVEQWYYSLQYGLGRIVLPPPEGHPNGARLRLVVELRLESHSFEEIGRTIPGRIGRETARRWLGEAFYWLCHPEGGRLLDARHWPEPWPPLRGQNGR